MYENDNFIWFNLIQKALLLLGSLNLELWHTSFVSGHWLNFISHLSAFLNPQNAQSYVGALYLPVVEIVNCPPNIFPFLHQQ